MDLDQSEIKLYIIKSQQNTVHRCIFVQNKKPWYLYIPMFVGSTIPTIPPVVYQKVTPVAPADRV